MKFLKTITICAFVFMISLFAFQIAFATSGEKSIEKVEITDIQYPYSTGSILDTTAKVSSSSNSIVNEVSWSKTTSGLYMVTITVRPYDHYKYDENTTATVNGNDADYLWINDDEYLEISYTFDNDNTIVLPNSANSLVHVITVYKPTNGTISPSIIRAPHNKNYTVQIIPDEGYQVKDVVVDGESVGSVTEYTFKKVTKPHKIRAVFELASSSTSSQNSSSSKESSLNTSSQGESFRLYEWINSIITSVVSFFS